jgi:hypothetical protein
MIFILFGLLGSPPPGYLSEDGDSQAIGLWIVFMFNDFSLLNNKLSLFSN